MSFDLPNTIEAWFTKCGEDMEFVRCGRADAYAVIGAPKTQPRPVYVYATKPSCVLKAKWKYPDFDVGLISRIGLPNTEDVNWIRDLLGRNELMFLGDMDPVDLMIFAWLRAHLVHARVTYLGISDSYLNQLGVVLPQTFIMSCAPSELTSLSFLRNVLPDFRELIGPNCAALLDDGRKIELEAVASSLGPPGPLLLPALIPGDQP
jgi:hypothetical protein